MPAKHILNYLLWNKNVNRIKSKLACDKNLFMEQTEIGQFDLKKKYQAISHWNAIQTFSMNHLKYLPRIEAKAILKRNGFFQAIGISKQKFTFFKLKIDWNTWWCWLFFCWYSGIYFTFYFSRVSFFWWHWICIWSNSIDPIGIFQLIQ